MADVVITYAQQGEPGPRLLSGGHLAGRDAVTLRLRTLDLEPEGADAVLSRTRLSTPFSMSAQVYCSGGHTGKALHLLNRVCQPAQVPNTVPQHSLAAGRPQQRQPVPITAAPRSSCRCRSSPGPFFSCLAGGRRLQRRRGSGSPLPHVCSLRAYH